MKIPENLSGNTAVRDKIVTRDSAAIRSALFTRQLVVRCLYYFQNGMRVCGLCHLLGFGIHAV